MRSDKLLFEDMLEACQKAMSYAASCTYEVFAEGGMPFDAAIRNLEILGEATGRLSHDAQDQLADVPIHKIRGLRNRLAHAYFDVDPEIAWNIITQELPLVAKRIEEVLGER